MPLVPFLLLLVGLAFLFSEFFLPGAILGAIGAILILSSIVQFAIETQFWIATPFFFVGAVIATYFTIKFALWKITHGKMRSSIYLEKDQEGYSASEWDKSLVGKEGKSVTEMKPGGRIRVEGKEYMAISKSGFIEKGQNLRVIDGEGETLYVVKEVNK
jgi:membrane-bound ClpP family serine protease